MERKYKILISIVTLTIFYILMLSYFYIDYSYSLKEVNSKDYDNFNTLQNIIHRVHDEDSALYRTLLSKEILNTNSLNPRFLMSSYNQSSNVISDLLDLNEDKDFTSQRLVSTIDEYYSLESLRNQILELHKKNILDGTMKYDTEISNLLQEYETQISITLIDINEEIDTSKENSIIQQEKLLSDFIKKEFISLIYYIFSISLLLYLFDFQNEFKSKVINKEDLILDSDMQKILSFVKNEISKGNFPTIKELKSNIKLSHPTLLNKLNELEKDNLIFIKKKGRNKHLFLK